MFWCEHIYVAFSTIYIGYLTLRRKSAYLRRKKISCYGQSIQSSHSEHARVLLSIPPICSILDNRHGSLCPVKLQTLHSHCHMLVLRFFLKYMLPPPLSSTAMGNSLKTFSTCCVKTEVTWKPAGKMSSKVREGRSFPKSNA